MQSQLKLSESVKRQPRCPVCGTNLDQKDTELICANAQCEKHFPVIENIPILINDSSSVFSISDFTAQRQTTLKQQKNQIKKILSQILPKIDANLKAESNYASLAKHLLSKEANPKVLVIGCGNLGQGLTSLLAYSSIELVESDVSFGNRTEVICDAHNLPFVENSFDGVIIQAVLEHVVDPYRCVDEIYRVLKEGGLVYSETPFMQPVHMGKYDFTRFTHLGHRRLFRRFEEIDSGAVGGPGMALAWSYQYFLLSFAKTELIKEFIKIFARTTSFYLKYFDYLLINNSGIFDAGSGYYFLGEKSQKILSDKELLELYRGDIK
jgi:SAM-dependent methyltransferase